VQSGKLRGQTQSLRFIGTLDGLCQLVNAVSYTRKPVRKDVQKGRYAR
jgi:hypothetical protein